MQFILEYPVLALRVNDKSAVKYPGGKTQHNAGGHLWIVTRCRSDDTAQFSTLPEHAGAVR